LVSPQFFLVVSITEEQWFYSFGENTRDFHSGWTLSGLQDVGHAGVVTRVFGGTSNRSPRTWRF